MNGPFLPHLTADSGADASSLQKDLAAGRAALQAELAKAPPAKSGDGWSGVGKPPMVHASSTYADAGAAQMTGAAALGREALKREREAGITYSVDRDGMQNDRSGIPRRIAKVRCHDCGSETLVHQAQDLSTGEYLPDAGERLSVFGWRTLGDLRMCGGACYERAKYKMAQHDGKPLPAVTRVNDQSYAKGMYATPAVVPVVAQETTPAAPPTIAAPKEIASAPIAPAAAAVTGHKSRR